MYHISFSYLCLQFLVCDSISVFLVYHDLDILRSTGQIALEISSSLTYFIVFLIIRLGICDFGKYITEMRCPTHYSCQEISDIQLSSLGDINPHYLVKVGLSGFSIICKSLNFICYLFVY